MLELFRFLILIYFHTEARTISSDPEILKTTTMRHFRIGVQDVLAKVSHEEFLSISGRGALRSEV